METKFFTAVFFSLISVPLILPFEGSGPGKDEEEYFSFSWGVTEDRGSPNYSQELAERTLQRLLEAEDEVLELVAKSGGIRGTSPSIVGERLDDLLDRTEFNSLVVLAERLCESGKLPPELKNRLSSVKKRVIKTVILLDDIMGSEKSRVSSRAVMKAISKVNPKAGVKLSKDKKQLLASILKFTLKFSTSVLVLTAVIFAFAKTLEIVAPRLNRALAQLPIIGYFVSEPASASMDGVKSEMYKIQNKLMQVDLDVSELKLTNSEMAGKMESAATLMQQIKDHVLKYHRKSDAVEVMQTKALSATQYEVNNVKKIVDKHGGEINALKHKLSKMLQLIEKMEREKAQRKKEELQVEEMIRTKKMVREATKLGNLLNFYRATAKKKVPHR